MVFRMCEGATDGCRRLIESCTVQHGDTFVHGRFALPTDHSAHLCLPYQSSFQVVSLHAWDPNPADSEETACVISAVKVSACDQLPIRGKA